MLASLVLEKDYSASARRVFEIEAEAISRLSEQLGDSFSEAVRRVLSSSGRVIVCGMGKSGIIGKKIAATLASTGTPSFFMHPGEAYHGDLGMVTAEDIFVAISYSGETDEVVKLLPFLRDNKNFLIAITGNAKSTLAMASDCHLSVYVSSEACALQLAPTSSTTATLAMGDALAVTLMEARDFKPENFARFHPGGALGRRLLSKVQHEMVSSNLPIVEESTSMIDVLRRVTQSKLGLAVVRCEKGWGIITDGDVRRALERFGKDVFDRFARDIMTSNPLHVSKDVRLETAWGSMDLNGVSSLLVLEGEDLVGILKR
ncbi:KpsF/GutQ family sugar-phosphate isomerase [uncultured Caulobacter sp.]|uniref:KpsF/GutQ family sugar-phosphate isomerase n=1 Tax=uncultured Caulobacter sp. TaxID=158749 RepID=UPI002613D37D|nr:KpsF/GutQ family sugar-phosphate isomerase [uncultured Caulobacter sp.]